MQSGVHGTDLARTAAGPFLKTVATELYALHGQLDQLQQAIGCLAALVPPHQACAPELQDMDRIEQTLLALSRFLDRMGDAVPASCLIDVRTPLSEITLSALQQSLSGQRAVLSETVPTDVELF